MKIIGLTGGIGSGKSTVAAIFEQLDIAVYSSDHRARWLMENDINLNKNIKDHFGPASYDSQNKLNRKFIADKVFNNKQERDWINSLVHPAVGQDFKDWSRNLKSIFVIYESALLIESLNHIPLAKLILVIANENLQIERVYLRDKIQPGEIRKRMDAQLKDEQRLKYADYIIYNQQEVSIIKQTLRIYNELLQLLS